MRWSATSCLRGICIAAAIASVIPAASPVCAQETQSASPYEGVTVREVRLEGLDRISPQAVRNEIRTAAGQPYREAAVQQDVRNLDRLGKFRRIGVALEGTPDGGVIVTYLFTEAPLAVDVQIVGNENLPDSDIAAVVPMRAGDPLDTSLIAQGVAEIERLYESRGFYLIQVEVDEDEMLENNIVLYRIREGPRVRVKDIDVRGNASIPTKEVKSNIRLKKAFFLVRPGRLDEDAIAADIDRIVNYYLDRGYLNVRVDRELQISNDQRECKVVYVIDEGPVHIVRSVRVEGSTRLTPEQVLSLIPIRRGDVYSQDRVRRAQETLVDSLGRMGYVESSVVIDELRAVDEPQVDLVIRIVEGTLAFTGEIRVVGNTITKRRVIDRELTIHPGRPLNEPELQESERKLRETRLFTDPRITISRPDSREPLFRDVTVEVEEANTGSVGFGAAVNTDLGLFGQIELRQSNFDITDFPDTPGEFFTGRAFRGGGQRFNISAQPGDEYSNFSISLTEPYVFGTNNSLGTSIAYTTRELEAWDEDRLGGRLTLGRRLGDVWVINSSLRAQRIELGDIDADAPRDIFAVEDENLISGIGFGLTRSTLNDSFRPSRGSRTSFDLEQIGVLGGDFDFTRFEASHTVYLTLDEDFIGRKSIFSLTGRMGYLFGGETPTYERFFLGGRSLRAFDYRTVSPKGIRNDTGRVGRDPVGGDWMVFLGAEYEFPLMERFLGGVVFVDSGTVTEDPGFEDYRIGAGFGFRVYVEAISPAPLAFDFALPVAEGFRDDTEVFSFSVDLPLR